MTDILAWEGCNMQVKTLVISLGIGAAAGAAAILLTPKHSQAYQTMSNVAETVKMEAGRMWDSMKKN